MTERTRDLTALSTHLQGVAEQEKSALSRELHDELGGLLVAARMDLSWLQQRLATTDPAIEQRYIHDYLSAGMGSQEACGRRTAAHPPRQHGLVHCAALALQAAIGVFRVAQEALTNILKHVEATSANLSIEVHKGWHR